MSRFTIRNIFWRDLFGIFCYHFVNLNVKCTWARKVLFVNFYPLMEKDDGEGLEICWEVFPMDKIFIHDTRIWRMFQDQRTSEFRNKIMWTDNKKAPNKIQQYSSLKAYSTPSPGVATAMSSLTAMSIAFVTKSEPWI